jgi:hypothetical protein
MSNASQGGKTYFENPIHPRFSGRPNTTQSIAKQNTKKSRLDYKGGRIETAFWSAWDKKYSSCRFYHWIGRLPAGTQLNITSIARTLTYLSEEVFWAWIIRKQLPDIPNWSRRFNWTMRISRAKKVILIVDKKALDRGSGSLVIAFYNLNHSHLGLVEWFLRLLPMWVSVWLQMFGLSTFGGI